MKPFELRLAQEHARLAVHCKNLSNFIHDKSRIERLGVEHRALLTEQLAIMEQYLAVLERRMSLLNIPI